MWLRVDYYKANGTSLVDPVGMIIITLGQEKNINVLGDTSPSSNSKYLHVLRLSDLDF